MLEPAQEVVREPDVRDVLDLGQHDDIEVCAGAAHDLHDVPVAPASRDGVDADGADLGAEIDRVQSVHDRGARALLLAWRARVLEVEHDLVGGKPSRLLDHAAIRRWDGEA